MREPKIYLDNCCFNRPYDDQTQDIIMLETAAKMLIQKMVYEQRVRLVWSYVLKYEVSRTPDPLRHREIAKWRKLSVEFITESPEIMNLAEEIEQTGIKPYDALHVACAITANCDYFISVDKRLLKYKNTKIILYNPLQFISIFEEGDEQ